MENNEIQLKPLLNSYNDQELIQEIKRRGFRVAKSDRIRMASSCIDVNVTELLSYAKEGTYMDYLYRDLGARLGVYILENGAVPIIQELSDHLHKRRFRATVTLIVDDPQFDWPYELKIRK